MLLETLKTEAIQRGYLKPEEEIDLRKAFFLVRDMPYIRASSRDSETIIREYNTVTMSAQAAMVDLLPGS